MYISDAETLANEITNITCRQKQNINNCIYPCYGLQLCTYIPYKKLNIINNNKLHILLNIKLPNFESANNEYRNKIIIIFLDYLFLVKSLFVMTKKKNS